MKKIKNVDGIAKVAGIGTSWCVCWTLGKIAGNCLPGNLKPFGTVVSCIGLGAIGSFVASKIANATEEDIKEILETINSMIPEDQYVTE